MTADTAADISRSVRALATPKDQSINAIAAEPITDSSNVTPTVIAKLIARSCIGHDIDGLQLTIRQFAAKWKD
jgi:hypothetical protein